MVEWEELKAKSFLSFANNWLLLSHPHLTSPFIEGEGCLAIFPPRSREGIKGRGRVLFV
jgi:hypothetical protein